MKEHKAITHIRALATLALLIHSLPASAQDVIAAASYFTVKVVSTVTYPFDQDYKGTGWGAGFLADRERGLIVTNAHVAGWSPSDVKVSFKGYSYQPAEKVYVDSHLDVAVLRVRSVPHDAVAGSLQCGADYAPGRAVIAFGHPWALDYTATRGIISGIKVADGVEALQTDAALNAGNSGGPLIDAETGKIAGINQSSLRRKGTEGLNFAVPIRLVCTILALLKENKDPAPPLLPVSFATGLEDGELAFAAVGGPWSDKFKIGDRVLAVEGDAASRTLSRVLDHMRGKERVTNYRIGREGQERDITVDLPEEKDMVKRLGIHVSGMIVGPAIVSGSRSNPLFIHFIDVSSPAEQAELDAGEEVFAIDGAVVAGNYGALLKALKERDGQSAELVVRRERSPAGSGHYDYVIRTMLVQDVFELNERGRTRGDGAHAASLR